jgi:hypothetical protein
MEKKRLPRQGAILGFNYALACGEHLPDFSEELKAARELFAWAK